MSHDALVKRLSSAGPKRILSLDGGGIRGCASLGYLKWIESEVVRKRMGAEATLSDYFDLIGGTSTGGIIATLLALGKSVDEVASEYLGLGEKVFSRRTWPARIPGLGFLFTRLSARPLEAAAKSIFSEKTTLGSPSVETGLCIVTKRADTYSTWPYLNHPQARFYAENAEIPLWKLIRATSAAPTFFYPIKIEIGRPGVPDYGVFVDGGVSMANNPAFQLFLVATLHGFPFRWKAGADRLLLVSVGTGRFDDRLYERDLLKGRSLYWARNVPELLMKDASDQVELTLQYLSSSPTARPIDWEVGTLDGDLVGGAEHLHYVRYNPMFEEKALRSVGVSMGTDDLQSLRDMSAGKNAHRLHDLGTRFASVDCHVSHFPPAFDSR